MTDTTYDFNLKEYVREYLDETQEVDPLIIGTQVVATLTDDQLRPALLSVIREVVQVQQSVHRNNRLASVRNITSDDLDTGIDELEKQFVPPKPKVGRPKIRGWVEELERFRNSTIVIDGITKRIGVCTSNDFFAAAQARFKIAAENQASGEFYERLGKALDNHNVKTFAKLPLEVQREVTGK